MIIQRGQAEARQSVDVSVIEDGFYPAIFKKCIEKTGQNGSFLIWLFDLEEVNKVPITVSVLTPAEWVPGRKLDSLMKAIGIDTTSSDMVSFDTDTIQKGTKVMLFCEKKQGKDGVLRLNGTKWGKYVPGARGTEPLEYPQDYYAQQQQQQQQAQAPVNVSYGQQSSTFIQKPNYSTTGMNPNMGQVSSVNRVTNPYGTPQSIPTGPVVKKVDFGNNNL